MLFFSECLQLHRFVVLSSLDRKFWRILALLLFPLGGHAQVPEGGRVVSGEIAIEQEGQELTVHQTTEAGIIDWNSFNVGNGFGVPR